MDPITVISLVGTVVGVANVATKLGGGLRHLQQEFNGALNYVDIIATQIYTIEFSILEICSLIQSSPNTFPTEYEPRLVEATTAVDGLVGQIRTHVEAVRERATRSTTRAKLFHTLEGTKLLQWKEDLAFQIQALELLLHTAKLRSQHEKALLLAKDSSRRVLEKASSVSVRISTSSCVPSSVSAMIGCSSRVPSSGSPRPAEDKRSPLDRDLMKTKVYQRTMWSYYENRVEFDRTDPADDVPEPTSCASTDYAVANRSGSRASGLVDTDEAISTEDRTWFDGCKEEKPSAASMFGVLMAQIRDEDQGNTDSSESEVFTTVTTNHTTGSSDLFTPSPKLLAIPDSGSDIEVISGEYANKSFQRLPAATSPETLSSDCVLHYASSDNIVPPFTNPILASKGGFSQVFRVEAPSDTNFGPTGGDSGSSFALKTLKGSDAQEEQKRYRAELEALKRFNSSRSPHIIKLLAAYECNKSFHFVFPWADGGSLRDLWKNQVCTSTVDHRSSPAFALWSASQLSGLSSALATIHSALNGPSEQTSKLSTATIHGVHGDIKPENILWFRGSGSDTSRWGTLRISDFGSSKFRDFASTRKSETTVSFTATYRAPEFDVEASKRCVSPAYDVWSLGCVMSEMAVWLLGGYDDVRRFNLARRIHVRDKAFFFTKETGDFEINPAVREQIRMLGARSVGLEPPMRQFISFLLPIIAQSLSIDENTRPRAEALVEQLNILCVNLQLPQIRTRL